MSINSILGNEIGKNLLSNGDALIEELEKEGILIFESYIFFLKVNLLGLSRKKYTFLLFS